MTECDDSTKTEPEQQWFRLELLTESPDTDSANLVQLGALGIEVQDEDTYVEGIEYPPIPTDQSRLIAFFDTDDAEALEANIETRLPDTELVSLADYTDRSWETAWMRYFEAIRLSNRVCVGPPWDRPKPPENGLALVIEPGMAFGTGSHATTRLCAELLDKLIADTAPESVLDVGCGSAILSMIAAGLGVEHVVGIDVDPKAVEVARTNIAENGFSTEQIELSTRPLDEIDRTYEVVVANILAPVLLELHSGLVDAVGPDGHLILSGIPEEQLDEILDTFDTADFRICNTEQRDEWLAVHLQCKTSTP